MTTIPESFSISAMTETQISILIESLRLSLRDLNAQRWEIAPDGTEITSAWLDYLDEQIIETEDLLDLLEDPLRIEIIR